MKRPPLPRRHIARGTGRDSTPGPQKAGGPAAPAKERTEPHNRNGAYRMNLRSIAAAVLVPTGAASVVLLIVTLGHIWAVR